MAMMQLGYFKWKPICYSLQARLLISHDINRKSVIRMFQKKSCHPRTWCLRQTYLPYSPNGVSELSEGLSASDAFGNDELLESFFAERSVLNDVVYRAFWRRRKAPSFK